MKYVSIALSGAAVFLGLAALILSVICVVKR